MFCPNCGNELPDGVVFCNKCGTRLTPVGGNYESPGEIRDQAPGAGPANPVSGDPETSEYLDYEWDRIMEEPAGKSRKGGTVLLIAVVAAIVLAAVAAVGFFFLRPRLTGAEQAYFDPFEGIEIVYSGTSPQLSAEISDRSEQQFTRYLSYTLDKSQDLQDGEIITLTLTSDEKVCREKFDALPSRTEKKYSVSGTAASASASGGSTSGNSSGSSSGSGSAGSGSGTAGSSSGSAGAQGKQESENSPDREDANASNAQENREEDSSSNDVETSYSPASFWGKHATTEGQIFPDSSTRYLTDSEVNSLDPYSAQDAINEIYARKGGIFVKYPEINDYYEQFSWYNGWTEVTNITNSDFNNYERENINKLSVLSSQANFSR